MFQSALFMRRVGRRCRSRRADSEAPGPLCRRWRATRSLRLSAHNRALAVLGFSPEIAVVRETRDSNAQLHDYSRTSGELRFVRQF